MRGKKSLYEFVKEAQETGRPVDIVFGSTPGWKKPWSRAITGYIIDSDAWYITFIQQSEQSVIDT